MTTIPVHMYAFSEDKSTVRHVVLPKNVNIDAVGDECDKILDEVFYFGQNDFQTQDCYSVSVGDVIQLGNRYFMVAGIGFMEMGKEEFDSLEVPTSSYAYRKSLKKV